jgi:hypothetical protein
MTAGRGIRFVLDTDKMDGDSGLEFERRLLDEVITRLRYVSSVEIPEAMGDDDDGRAERIWATADMLEQAVNDWWPESR